VEEDQPEPPDSPDEDASGPIEDSVDEPQLPDQVEPGKEEDPDVLPEDPAEDSSDENFPFPSVDDGPDSAPVEEPADDPAELPEEPGEAPGSPDSDTDAPPELPTEPIDNVPDDPGSTEGPPEEKNDTPTQELEGTEDEPPEGDPNSQDESDQSPSQSTDTEGKSEDILLEDNGTTMCSDEETTISLPFSTSGLIDPSIPRGESVPTCGMVPASASGVWYNILGTGNAVTVTTCDDGTEARTEISVYVGSCSLLVCEANNFNGLRENPDLCTTDEQSHITWNTTAGTLYHVRVHSYSTRPGGLYQVVMTEKVPSQRTY